MLKHSTDACAQHVALPALQNEAAARSVVETERAAFVTKRQTFHDTQAATLKARRTDKLKQLDRDEAVHRSLLRRKEEAEREELRVELALAEATRRRQAEAVQLAAQDVTHGIDTFEINMKRLLKGMLLLVCVCVCVGVGVCGWVGEVAVHNEANHACTA